MSYGLSRFSEPVADTLKRQWTYLQQSVVNLAQDLNMTFEGSDAKRIKNNKESRGTAWSRCDQIERDLCNLKHTYCDISRSDEIREFYALYVISRSQVRCPTVLIDETAGAIQHLYELAVTATAGCSRSKGGKKRMNSQELTELCRSLVQLASQKIAGLCPYKHWGSGLRRDTREGLEARGAVAAHQKCSLAFGSAAARSENPLDTPQTAMFHAADVLANMVLSDTKVSLAVGEVDCYKAGRIPPDKDVGKWALSLSYIRYGLKGFSSSTIEHWREPLLEMVDRTINRLADIKGDDGEINKQVATIATAFIVEQVRSLNPRYNTIAPYNRIILSGKAYRCGPDGKKVYDQCFDQLQEREIRKKSGNLRSSPDPQFLG